MNWQTKSLSKSELSSSTRHRAMSGRVSLAELEQMSECLVLLDGRIDGVSAENSLSYLHESYEKFGSDFPKHLNGDFVAGIVDPFKRAVIFARDSIGQRSFYYCLESSSLVYSTDLYSLLKLLGHQPEPDYEAMAYYLLDTYFLLDRTFYSGLRRLSPGSILRFDWQGLKVSSYFRPDFQRQIRYSSENEYLEHFAELFSQAVACRLVEGGTTGVLLSGGVDSSLLAAQADVLTSGRESKMATFSAVFDEEGDDPKNLAYVCSQLSCPSFSFQPEPSYPLIDLEFGEEYRDITYYPTFFMYRKMFEMAQERQISRVLTGFGGDDVFAVPDEYFADLLTGCSFNQLFRELSYATDGFLGRAKFLLRAAVQPCLPGTAKKLMRQLVPRALPAWLNSSYFKHKAIVEQIAEHHRQRFREFDSRAKEALFFRLYHWGGIQWGMEQEQALALRSGIELAWPLFDHRLIDYSFRIPSQQLQKDGWSKHILRRLVLVFLPQGNAFTESRQNYNYFVERAMKRQRKRIEFLFAEEPLIVSSGLVDNVGLRQLKEYAFRNNEYFDLLRLVHLEQWMKHNG